MFMEDTEVHGCWGWLNPVCLVSGTHMQRGTVHCECVKGLLFEKIAL